MRLNKALLENAQPMDPFSDMPKGMAKKCRMAADLADVMYHYRINHGLNQTQMGEKLGMKQSQISKLESGDCNLTVERIDAILAQLRYKIYFSPIPETSACYAISRDPGWFVGQTFSPSPNFWAVYA